MKRKQVNKHKTIFHIHHWSLVAMLFSTLVKLLLVLRICQMITQGCWRQDHNNQHQMSFKLNISGQSRFVLLICCQMVLPPMAPCSPMTNLQQKQKFGVQVTVTRQSCIKEGNEAVSGFCSLIESILTFKLVW